MGIFFQSLMQQKRFTNFREVAFYVLGGGTGTVLNLATAYILTSLAHWFYFYSYIVGSFINYTFNFFWHRAITFRCKDKTAKRAAFYYISNIILGLFALGFTYIFTSIFHIQYLISGLIATIVVVIINFLFSKLITFGSKI